MNGMERLTDAAARHGWTRREDPAGAGYSRTVVYWRGDQSLEVYRRVDGGVTYGSRNWGPRTIATAPKVADQVLAWMQEPTPDDESDRGFFFRLATGHGWNFLGITSGYVFEWGHALGAPKITVRVKKDGTLLGADRTFNDGGGARSWHTNVPSNITPWFHAFIDRKGAGYDCGCTGRAQSLEPGEVPTTADVMSDLFDAGAFQGPAKTPIRPALPNTPDRKLQTLLEELDRVTRDLRSEASEWGTARQPKPGREGTTWAYPVERLAELSGRLEDLEAQVRTAKQEALYLWAERKYDATAADAIRQVHARENHG